LYRKGYENLIEQCRLINNSSLLERLEQKWSSNKRTHTDLGAKRLEKDSQHVKLISAWFSTHNPFIEVSIDLFHLLIVAQKSFHISVTICGTFTYHLSYVK